MDVGERGLKTKGQRHDRQELTKRAHGERKPDVAPVREQPTRRAAWEKLMEGTGGAGPKKGYCPVLNFCQRRVIVRVCSEILPLTGLVAAARRERPGQNGNTRTVSKISPPERTSRHLLNWFLLAARGLLCLPCCAAVCIVSALGN